MGATADKVKGATNEAIGKAKQGIGEATGSDRLQGEGVIQEVKGKGQKAVGDAKQATKDAVNNAAAAANKNLLSRRRRTIKGLTIKGLAWWPVPFLFLSPPRHHVRIDHIFGFARGISDNLIENIRELNLVFVARDITEMRRADNVG